MDVDERENFDAIKVFLSTSLREQFPTLTLRKGTGFNDIIDIAAFIYKTFKDELDEAKILRSLKDYETLPEDKLDSLLANWYANRNVGNKSQGTIRMYFREVEIIEVAISTGFRPLTKSGLIFYPIRPYTFSRSYLMQRVSEGFYYCDVEVMASDAGDQYNIESATAFNVTGILRGATLDRTANIIDFTGGINKESNVDYFNRAVQSFINRELTARGGLEAFVKENFAWANDVTIVGPGEVEMQRDVVQDLIDFPIASPYMSGAWIFLTFLNKIRADLTIPHVAYKFQYTANGLPSLDDLLVGISEGETIIFDVDRDELRQEDYDHISKADATSMLYRTGVIFEDNFNRENLFETLGKLLHSEYIIVMQTFDEINVTNNWIRDDDGDFINKGVLIGDYIGIKVEKEGIIGSETLPETADEVNVIQGKLVDNSMEFIGVVEPGDTLYLKTDAPGVKSCTVLAVEEHILYGIIPSPLPDSYTDNYWIVKEAERIVDFKITNVEATKLYADLLSKYTYKTQYCVKRNEYEFVLTGWKASKEDISTGAIRIKDGALCLGVDPGEFKPVDLAAFAENTKGWFRKLAMILGIETAKEELDKCET